MDKLPFSVYDFFGYLASGFVILAAADYAFDGGWLLRNKVATVFAVFWIIVAYIIGHIVANAAGFVLERKIVREVLRSPEEILFEAPRKGGWAKIFPGFYDPLPAQTADRVLRIAKEKAGISEAGRGLFFHCQSVVQRDKAAGERLSTFLNLYGFCRNMSLALVIAAIVLVAGAGVRWYGGQIHPRKFLWAAVAVVACVGMFYRYLKFFRQYILEVFVSYPECG